uniref:Uncharacterized protein n=1 Tax=Clytia hemisphaerica TaxID=252671 RepID=A0A7M5XAU6_9CNID
MGNSVRSTLGNLCGAEASKELPDEDQKPVAKPKEKSPKAEKKKEKKQKKKKKKKKGKGGELGKIDEDVGESDVITDPPSSSFVDESSESKIESSTKEPVDGSQSPSYERKLMTSDNKKANMTLLEQSIEAERQTSPEPQTMTFVIENIPENGKSPVNTSTPTDKNAIQQIIVEEEEHNTLDFGKYILVDPNTGDIAVMRNRSRSLDSLVSIQSNRSSISKFGSFEFVTDYELTIAEKNQQLKS